MITSAKLLLTAARIKIAAIPRGCTKLLQPADVSWNGPIKVAYHQLYDHCVAEGKHTETAGENMRALLRDPVIS